MTTATAPRRGPLAARGPWAAALLALASGGLLTLAQPPVSVWPALFLALPLAVWLIDRAPSGRAAFAAGWLAGFGYFTTGLHWIGHAFLVEADRFAWMIPFAVTLLPAFLGLFWGTAFWLSARRWPSGPARGGVLAGWLTLIEYARGNVLTGFPWALPGYAWVDTPVAQWAAVTGPFGLTLATLLLGALPLVAVVRAWRDGWRHAWPGAAALAVLAAAWAVPPPSGPPDRQPAAPVIRLVQPNAPQHLKFAPGWVAEFYRRVLDGSRAPAGPDGPPDLVVWPETAVPFIPGEAPQRMAEMAEAVGDATLVTGAFGRARGRLTNTLWVIRDGAVTHRYDKHHLVPFGEYLPYPWLFGALGFGKLLPGQGFAAGPGPRTLQVPGLPSFSPNICYETIFPDEVVPPGGPRPDFLLQVTNDAWFGTFAGPQQHLAQAQMRAIEQGLPVVRSANTGISAVIDARGRITASLPLNATGHVDAPLPAPLQPTPYTMLGDWPALAISLLIATSGFMRGRLSQLNDGCR